MYEDRNEKKRGKNFWAGNTPRILSVSIVILLLLSAMPVSVSNNEIETKSTVTKNAVFGSPEVKDDGKYVTIDVEGTINILNAGKPILPVKKVIFEFPIGTTISDVTCNHPPPQIMPLSKQVEPGPKPLPLVSSEGYSIAERLMKFFGKIFSRFPSRFQNLLDDNTFVMDENIYGSENYWPDNWFTYRVMVGINKEGESTTFVVVDVHMVKYSPGTSTIQYIADATVDISYNEPAFSPKPLTNGYNLLILAPSKYIRDLGPLVDHKEDVGISTELVCLDDVYDDDVTEVGRDNAEKVKLYIEKAKRESDIKYVMLVGGYRTFFGLNMPNQQFPVRYCHLDDGAEDGYVSDLYFADIYKYDSSEGYVFDDWDSNGNGIFAEWGWSGKDELDFMPDVYVGRLACRNTKEVKTMVDKIITYETETYGEEWFNKMLVISGDGFQDAPNWDIQWDTNQVLTGEYTIYAQSQLQSDPSVKGLIDVVNVMVDHSVDSVVTFSEDDHLKIDPLDPDSDGMVYPAHPVAEITVPSECDILGRTDVNEVPRAYIGDRWTKIEYNDGILKIKGKSYDPRPFPDGDYGSHTKYHIWIECEGTVVKDYPLGTSDMWWEGETETQIAMDYMSNDFEKQVLWTSNGNFTGQDDVIESMNEGSGFVYFAGHGNPMVWANHYPGIPGGRGPSSVEGLKNFGFTRPFFPMNKLRNREKLPVLLVGGCHNSMFDCSLMKLVYDPQEVLFTVKHGAYIPECWSWWLTRLSKGGAIGTIGCSGLGYGYLGKYCTQGLGGWINPEFFRQYANGIDILGETYGQTVASYITTFNPSEDQTDAKTVEEWVFLGDPSLKIGGYGSSLASSEISEISAMFDDVLILPLSDAKIISDSNDVFLPRSIANEISGDEYKVTANPYIDSDVTDLTGFNGDFLVGYSREDDGIKNAGFAVSHGGVVWDEMLWATPGDASDTTIQHLENKAALVSCMFDEVSFGVWTASDFTDPSTWSRTAWYFPGGQVIKLGKTGLTVTGQRDKFGTIAFGGLWSCKWQGSDSVMFMFNQDNYVHGIGGVFEHFSGDVDESTGWHYWVCDKPSGGGLIIVGTPPSTYTNTMISSGFAYPDVAADDGYAYIVFEAGSGINVKVSTNNGATWSTYTVASNGKKPEIVINPDGSLDCYYIVDDAIIKTYSDTHGQTWKEVGTVVLKGVDHESTFDVTTDALVYGADDGDLYAQIYIDTACAIIRDIRSPSRGYVTANITNSGNTYLEDAKWEVKVESADPLGDYLFGGTIHIFRGRVLLGKIPRSLNVDLAVGESIEVRSKRIFGIGHINVVVTMYNDDDEILGTSSEDGFLLGGRMLLYHPIE